MGKPTGEAAWLKSQNFKAYHLHGKGIQRDWAKNMRKIEVGGPDSILRA